MTTPKDPKKTQGDPQPEEQAPEEATTPPVSQEHVPVDEKLQELETENLRLHADLQNLRKRFDKERMELPLLGAEKMIKHFFPLFDHFALAAHNAPEGLDDWGKGILAIHSEMEKLLEQEGVEVLGSIGETIDPELHQVISLDPEAPEGQISEVLQKGYRWKGRVLRVAMVRAGGVQ